MDKKNAERMAVSYCSMVCTVDTCPGNKCCEVYLHNVKCLEETNGNTDKYKDVTVRIDMLDTMLKKIKAICFPNGDLSTNKIIVEWINIEGVVVPNITIDTNCYY